MAERQPRKETRNTTGRKQRKPMGGPQQKLTANVPGGMRGHWFNDRPGRLQRALEAGYEFINDAGEKADRASARTEIVGVNEDGSPLHAYLMAIPEEWYQEDQAAKQASVDEIDATLKRGNMRNVQAGDEKAYYVPDEGISIRRD